MWLFTISATSGERKHQPGINAPENTAFNQIKQICSPVGMECIRKRTSLSCGVACQGVYADVTTRQKIHFTDLNLCSYLSSREATDEREQIDQKKLMTMKQEYERYKDLWGLNVQYSHSAGSTQNYSELELNGRLLIFVLAEKNKLDLQLVHIYFDTSTFDRVEKDVKVLKLQNMSKIFKILCQVTVVAQLGVIGGTMGLFTGFSILSGIEIVYFAAKFFLRKMRSCESNVYKKTNKLSQKEKAIVKI